MGQENSGSSSGVPLVKPPLEMPRQGVFRPGRGFSYGEVEKAGASIDDMKSANLRVDHLRKSAHDVNVKTLQELLGTRGKERGTQKTKPKETAKAAPSKKQEERKKAKPKGSRADKK